MVGKSITRRDGTLEKTEDRRCNACGGKLNALTLAPGIEVCRECAIPYAVDDKLVGSTFHVTNIMWYPKKEQKPVGRSWNAKISAQTPTYYRSAHYDWHPTDQPCQHCTS